MSLAILREPPANPSESPRDMLYFMNQLWNYFNLVSAQTVAPGTIDALTTYTTALDVPGAREGQTILIGAPAALQAGMLYWGTVTSSNVVTLSIYNSTTGALEPASATWNIRVIQ
jgi:hypothetical protein